MGKPWPEANNDNSVASQQAIVDELKSLRASTDETLRSFSDTLSELTFAKLQVQPQNIASTATLAVADAKTANTLTGVQNYSQTALWVVAAIFGLFLGFKFLKRFSII